MIVNACVDVHNNPLFEGVPPQCALPIQLNQEAYGLNGLGCPGVSNCSCKHTEQERGFVTGGGSGLMGLGDLTDDIASSFSSFTSYLGSAADQVVNSVGQVSIPTWLPYAAIATAFLFLYRPGYSGAKKRARQSTPTVAGRIKRAVKSF